MDATTWVVERVTQLPLGLPYAEQIRLLQPEIDALDHLAIDAGGSGQALPELVQGARLKTLVPVVITGGTGKGKVVKGRVTVGKSALIQGMMQQVYHRELRVDPGAPGRDLLLAEMRSFRYLPDRRFRRMEAARGAKDDAVLATSLAAYLSRRVG